MAQHPNSRRAFRHNQLRGNVAMSVTLIGNVANSELVTEQTRSMAMNIVSMIATLQRMVEIRVDPPKED